MNKLEKQFYVKVNSVDEDLRKWFGKGGKGSSTGGGWDRYSSSGTKLGKCGDGEKGDAYAACFSKSKAAKLGKKGIANFVKRKRAAQKKGGDSKKGGEQSKGQKAIKVKTERNHRPNCDTPDAKALVSSIHWQHLKA